jgi:hypothetical protein
MRSLMVWSAFRLIKAAKEDSVCRLQTVVMGSAMGDEV